MVYCWSFNRRSYTVPFGLYLAAMKQKKNEVSYQYWLRKWGCEGDIAQILLKIKSVTFLPIWNHIADDNDREGPGNVGLLTIQPPNTAASPRIFY
jgi:hypothetical protein